MEGRFRAWSPPRFPAGTTRCPWASSSHGSRLTPTVWTTWSGCAGRMGSCARNVVSWAAGGWATAVPLRDVPVVHVTDGGHDLRPDAHAADGVVHRVLAVRHPEGRHLGAEPAAGTRDQLVPDGLGDAAPGALGAGPPRAGAVGWVGRGGRDVHRRRGTGAAGRALSL